MSFIKKGKNNQLVALVKVIFGGWVLMPHVQWVLVTLGCICILQHHIKKIKKQPAALKSVSLVMTLQPASK